MQVPPALTRVAHLLTSGKTGRLKPPEWRDAPEDRARQGWAEATAVELLCLASPWSLRHAPRDGHPGPQVVVSLGRGVGFLPGLVPPSGGYGVLQKLTQVARPPVKPERQEQV